MIRRVRRSMKCGSSTRLTTNALLFTTARYSRTAMTIVLRMLRLLLGLRRLHLLRLRRGDAHENVVQARMRDLEMLDWPVLEQRRQDQLRISIARQPQLLEIPMIDDVGHARQLVEL